MAVLFYSSSQTYAQQSQVSNLNHLLGNKPFGAFLDGHSFSYGGTVIDANKNYYKYVEFFIRKFAHFSTYFVMGMAWFMGLKGRFKNYPLVMVISWQAATGYAALDEFHQKITGGRSPMFEDVVLDSLGAATGIIMALLIVLLVHWWRGRHVLKEEVK